MIRAIAMAAVCLVVASAPGEVVPEIQGWGTLHGFRIDGQYFPFALNVRVPAPQWKKVAGLQKWEVKEIKQSTEDGVTTFIGNIPFGDATVRFSEQFRAEGDAVRVKIELTPNKDTPAEGLFVTMALPVGDFGGGQVTVSEPKTPVEPRALPATRPSDEQSRILSASSKGLTFSKASRTLGVAFDQPRNVAVQDERRWNNPSYSAQFPIHTGNLVAGQTSSAEMVFTPSCPVDRTPVVLKLEAQKPTWKLDGFGGSFVYGADAPQSKYNLENLNVAWSRVWLPLHEWEPENDNGDPQKTDMARLAANDKPQTNLRKAMDISQELQQRKIPYIASIWPMPKWLLSNPWTKTSDAGRKISLELVDELAESIGSYLLYAKEKYSVEPDMFSFNEPDYGVTVKLTPEEHTLLIKVLGRHFEKLGLKTRMLLADVAHARGNHTFAEPTVADAEAMRYVPYMAIHTWGGATPEQYGAWRDLAARARRPLLVTEAGVDAQAWNYSGIFRDYAYAFSEARQYQDILLYARPQGIILWEYSSDYGLETSEGGTLVPLKRFYFIKQFATLTPRGGQICQTTSSLPQVLFTAVKGEDGSQCLHILNDGASRDAEVGGILSGAFRCYVTDRGRDAAEVATVSAIDGKLKLNLPAWSMVTLRSE